MASGSRGRFLGRGGSSGRHDEFGIQVQKRGGKWEIGLNGLGRRGLLLLLFSLFFFFFLFLEEAELAGAGPYSAFFMFFNVLQKLYFLVF